MQVNWGNYSRNENPLNTQGKEPLKMSLQCIHLLGQTSNSKAVVHRCNSHMTHWCGDNYKAISELPGMPAFNSQHHRCKAFTHRCLSHNTSLPQHYHWLQTSICTFQVTIRCILHAPPQDIWKFQKLWQHWAGQPSKSGQPSWPYCTHKLNFDLQELVRKCGFLSRESQHAWEERQPRALVCVCVGGSFPCKTINSQL